MLLLLPASDPMARGCDNTEDTSEASSLGIFYNLDIKGTFLWFEGELKDLEDPTP